MKLKHISKDSSSSLFSINNRSVSDLYPRLQFGAELPVLVPSQKLIDVEDFLSMTINTEENLFVSASQLSEVLNNYFTTWSRDKFPTWGLDNHVIYNSQLTQIVDPSYPIGHEYRINESYKNRTLSEAEDALIQAEAESLGYSTSTSTLDKSYREGFLSNIHFDKIPTGEEVSQSDIDRDDLDFDDVFKLQQDISKAWRSIEREVEKEGNIKDIDVNVTEGSVAPLYPNGYEEGFSGIKGILYYSPVGRSDIYKESFSMHFTENKGVATNPTLGVQVLVTNPYNTSSVVKVVWDNTLIESATLVNIKLFKIKD